MTCRQFADFMMDYLSGDLSAEIRQEFDRHLSLCMNCRKYLAGYEETIRLGRRAFKNDDTELPPDVPEDLVKAIMAARRPITR
jgi:anti-sigma factor RsiW